MGKRILELLDKKDERNLRLGALLAADFVRLGEHYQGGVSLRVQQIQHPPVLG